MRATTPTTPRTPNTMTSTIAPELESDHSETESRPTVDRQPADTTRRQPASHCLDPTQGRQIGSDPYADPTQGRRIGSNTYDDPTQAR
jgi:hypothetical protein